PATRKQANRLPRPSFGQTSRLATQIAPKSSGTASGKQATPPELVGRRLQRSFAELLRAIPAPVDGASALSRWLGVDRSICQRLIMGVRDAQDGLGVLERFPGVRGLEQLVAAAQTRGLSADVIAAARQSLQ